MNIIPCAVRPALHESSRNESVGVTLAPMSGHAQRAVSQETVVFAGGGGWRWRKQVLPVHVGGKIGLSRCGGGLHKTKKSMRLPLRVGVEIEHPSHIRDGKVPVVEIDQNGLQLNASLDVIKASQNGPVRKFDDVSRDPRLAPLFP